MSGRSLPCAGQTPLRSRCARRARKSRGTPGPGEARGAVGEPGLLGPGGSQEKQEEEHLWLNILQKCSEGCSRSTWLWTSACSCWIYAYTRHARKSTCCQILEPSSTAARTPWEPFWCWCTVAALPSRTASSWRSRMV